MNSPIKHNLTWQQVMQMPDEDAIIVIMYLDMPRLTLWSRTKLCDKIARAIGFPAGKALRDKLIKEQNTPEGKQKHIERIKQLDKPIWVRFAEGEYKEQNS